MIIKIGHVDVDPRTLDKRSNFNSNSPFDLDVQISQPCNIKKPAFLLDVSHVSPGYNYAYVPLWDVYYFLSEPTIIDGVRANVNGEMDYLTTYADGIKSLSGYLVRTADTAKRNKFLSDNRKQVQSNCREYTYQFNRSPFRANFATDIVYLLTVIGGIHT